jgi:serine/threonine protein kinase
VHPSQAIFQPLQPDDPREVGGYRIIARLGEGGMGRVYLGTTQAGRRLAIKVIRPEFSHDEEFRRRFEHEVSAAQRVHSMYTAPVIDADVAGPQPWLATAFVPGPTLDQVVAAHGPLPTATVRVLMAGVAEALHVVHAAGVIHRDLKPSNVLLAEDGPKVIDFGIARAAEATALTRTGMRIGTPQFMAPEQALGHPSTPALDVFALGSLTCFALTGRTPFGEGPTATVLYRIAHEPPDLEGLPGELRPLLERCLSKAPDHRPGIREIISSLQVDTVPVDWLPQQVSQRLPAFAAEPPRSPASTTLPSVRRRRGWVAAGAAAVAAMGAVAVVLVNNTGPDSPDMVGAEVGRTPTTSAPAVVVTQTVSVTPTTAPSTPEPTETEEAAATSEPSESESGEEEAAPSPSESFPGEPVGEILYTGTVDHARGYHNLDGVSGHEVATSALGLGAESNAMLHLRQGSKRPSLKDCKDVPRDQWDIFIDERHLRTPAVVCLRTGSGRYGYLRIFYIGRRGPDEGVRDYDFSYAIWKKPGDR